MKTSDIIVNIDKASDKAYVIEANFSASSKEKITAKNIEEAINAAKEEHLENDIYPFILAKTLNPKNSKKISEDSLNIFFIEAFLYFEAYKVSESGKCLWISYFLLQHVLQNEIASPLSLQKNISISEDKLENKYHEWKMNRSLQQNISMPEDEIKPNPLTDKVNELVNVFNEKFSLPVIDKKAENKLSSSSLFAMLPDEMILMIMSFLEVKPLMALSRSNREFYQLSKNNRLWEELELNHFVRLNNYINHCRNNFYNDHFIHASSHERIVDFHASQKLIPHHVEEVISKKMDIWFKFARQNSAWRKSKIFDAYVAIGILLCVGIGIYFANQQRQDLDKQKTNGAGKWFSILAVFAYTSIGSLFGLACVSLIVGGALHMCYSAGIFGVNKTADVRSRRQYKPFLISASSEQLNMNTFFASKPTDAPEASEKTLSLPEEHESENGKDHEVAIKLR